MSHARNLRLLPLFAFLLASSLAEPPGARAQSALETAQGQAQAAREAYHSLDLDTALEQARAAVDTCERGGCPGPDMARYYVLQGMVEYAASQDRDRARAMFRQAVHTDANVELDPELATPELQSILVDAREDVAIDGSLSPEQAARTGQPEDGPRGHEGATCHSDDACGGGLICEENQCVPGERVEPDQPWQRFFLEVGFNMAAATASHQMTPTERPVVATGNDPQADSDLSNDSYYLGGTNGCNAPAPADGATPTADNYCVRVTSGLFVFAPGLHVGAGLWLTERIGLSVRARIGFGNGGGTLAFVQVGLRAHFRLVVPKPDGFHLSLFLGGGVGQIQVRPKQEPTMSGGSIQRPWAQTGIAGAELGANIGYRFTPNVGIIVQPGVYALFPDFSLGLQATVGLDLAFGAVGGAPPPPPEPEPEDDDRDGDRILNHNDACPDEAEDVDGFEDTDGCPELDNDNDGIVDAADACPREAEDMDGFEDGDGCPERDNDGDGVPDVDDACPNEVGVGIARGCPEPDRDGDGLVDRMDNCPDEAGPRENHGCQEEQFVEIQEDRLVITQIIYFRTNRDVIEERSFHLLAQIANVLNAHPEIQRVSIEGHTDSRGRARNNLRLSQRRALAVMNHLVRTGGVDPARLSSEGYGSERPVIENATTEEEHAQNRRVEFVIHHDAM
ncbi:MAG: OmpA family protein [Polyangiales bacterium]|nr:OmpA family protein [Sandaracinaceae bacterium]